MLECSPILHSQCDTPIRFHLDVSISPDDIFGSMNNLDDESIRDVGKIFQGVGLLFDFSLPSIVESISLTFLPSLSSSFNMCTEFTTAKNWDTSLTHSPPSCLRPAIPLGLKLLTLPAELRLTILGLVANDNMTPALKYSEFCRLFLSASSTNDRLEIKGFNPCTCRTSTDCHSLLHVNRQLRQEYLDVLKQNANILICHCNLFSRICALEESLSLNKDRISNLRRVSLSVKQSPTRNNTGFLGDDLLQTWPYRDSEHRIVLTSLGVHLTMFLTISCIDAFANLEEVSILLEISKETTFLALDERDMGTVLNIILWKMQSRLTRLRHVQAQVDYGTFWKRQGWTRIEGVWKATETLKSSY